MIKLGVNSVLFQGHDLETAVKTIAYCGYDGIEISAIKGMCDHLDLDRWQEQAQQIKDLVAKYKLPILSSEVASLDETRLTKAFEAAQDIGIPILNVGPGGKSDVEEDFQRQAEQIQKMAEKAGRYGVTLCVKAHVNCCVYNTPTTLRLMDRVTAKAFGVDMDPSHIWRANEKPEQALAAAMKRVKHVHIRDCKGMGPKPGEPRDQACGRGDIDLFGYCRAMVEGRYDGPVCLEVIGAKEYDLWQCATIAAETYGYLNACLKALGAR